MKFSTIIQSTRELGLRQAWFYARYQLGLRSGYYRWRTAESLSLKAIQASPRDYRPLWIMPERQSLQQMLGPEGLHSLLAEADGIAAGQVRLFGAEPVSLQLVPPGTLHHWTSYDDPTGDIKLTWEPARFGWAYTLGQAYQASGDERYPRAFWQFAETFLDANPPYHGPNWESGQEVALRLIAFTFAMQVFAPSPHSSAPRVERLVRSIQVHAARIPPTLAYAHAQNNNHLLSEAAGLYTAAACLPTHPEAARWRRLGWAGFNRGIQSQVSEDGAYTQNSANYHRLMLQLALWFDCLAQSLRQPLPELTRQRLSAATGWLLALVDPLCGQVPNLGPNDGAYIQPLTVCPFDDFRPVLQAAALAFTGQRSFPPGAWDATRLWFRSNAEAAMKITGFSPRTCGNDASYSCTPHILRSRDHDSWAYLRVARFRSRPGHADQLCLDLWWRGLNLALDSGTYLYNAPPPWDNALTHTSVHNTVMVENQEQMHRAGRFLYLDWAQAEVIEGEQNGDGAWRRLAARHDGYRCLGVYHQRMVQAGTQGRWLVVDQILPVRARLLPPETIFLVRLHWLLPDWPWEVDGSTLSVQSPHGLAQLSVSAVEGLGSTTLQVYLARAGKLIYGSGEVQPTWGWVSPTYDVRLPALSFSVTLKGRLPVRLQSEWRLGADI